MVNYAVKVFEIVLPSTNWYRKLFIVIKLVNKGSFLD